MKISEIKLIFNNNNNEIERNYLEKYNMLSNKNNTLSEDNKSLQNKNLSLQSVNDQFKTDIQLLDKNFNIASSSAKELKLRLEHEIQEKETTQKHLYNLKQE